MHCVWCIRIILVGPGPAKEFYDAFCDRVRREHVPEKVAEGVFGAYMEVSIVRNLCKRVSVMLCSWPSC